MVLFWCGDSANLLCSDVVPAQAEPMLSMGSRLRGNDSAYFASTTGMSMKLLW